MFAFAQVDMAAAAMAVAAFAACLAWAPLA